MPQWARTVRARRGAKARKKRCAVVAWPLRSTSASTIAMALRPGKCGSPGVRRSPLSQATSWLTRWRRVSMRPWSASVVSCSGRARASALSKKSATSQARERWLSLSASR